MPLSMRPERTPPRAPATNGLRRCTGLPAPRSQSRAVPLAWPVARNRPSGRSPLTLPSNRAPLPLPNATDASRHRASATADGHRLERPTHHRLGSNVPDGRAVQADLPAWAVTTSASQSAYAEWHATRDIRPIDALREGVRPGSVLTAPRVGKPEMNSLGARSRREPVAGSGARYVGAPGSRRGCRRRALLAS